MFLPVQRLGDRKSKCKGELCCGSQGGESKRFSSGDAPLEVCLESPGEYSLKNVHGLSRGHL